MQYTSVKLHFRHITLTQNIAPPQIVAWLTTCKDSKCCFSTVGSVLVEYELLVTETLTWFLQGMNKMQVLWREEEKKLVVTSDYPDMQLFSHIYLTCFIFLFFYILVYDCFLTNYYYLLHTSLLALLQECCVCDKLNLRIIRDLNIKHGICCLSTDLQPGWNFLVCAEMWWRSWRFNKSHTTSSLSSWLPLCDLKSTQVL